MGDDEKAKDLQWIGSALVFGVIAWTLVFARSTAQPAPQPLGLTRTQSDALRWVTGESQSFGFGKPAKKIDWLQVLMALVIIVSIAACATAVYLRIESENSAAASFRPDVAVRLAAINATEGDYSTEMTLEDSGKSPAINTELTTLILPDETRAEEFLRLIESGKSGTAPSHLEFVIPGTPRSYQSPIVVPEPFRATVEQRLATHQPVTAIGLVTYQDRRGRTYETDFCFTSTPDGRMQPCVVPLRPAGQ